MKMKFYKCEICGNIIAIVEGSGVPVVCCGQNMTPIEPGTSDGAVEKHVPVYEIKGNMVHVKVGSSPHPMEQEHYIKWIALETSSGNQRKCLKPGELPEACFALCEGDEVLNVYEYCNLHGLFQG